MNLNVYNKLFAGNQNVSSTGVQITTDVHEVRHGVTVIAASGNTNSIMLGASGVTTATGFPLKPGIGITIPIDSPHKVWAISENDGNDLRWILV